MTRNHPWIHLAGSIGITLLLGASSASAITPVETADDGVEIDRTSAELGDELRPRDVDRDIADTALVFTNFSGTSARVRCVAYDRDGHAVGRAWVGVPALGVRYLLASDFANGADFIGHARCGTSRAVRGTAVFLGGGITDLPAIQPRPYSGRIRFPLVATC